jgi:hypothetical protein
MDGFHLRIYPIISNKTFCDQFKVVAGTVKHNQERYHSDADTSIDIPTSPSTFKRKRENVNSTIDVPQKRKTLQSPVTDVLPLSNLSAPSLPSSKYQLSRLSLQSNDSETERLSDAIDIASPESPPTPTSISSSRHEQSLSPSALISSIESITATAPQQQSSRLKISLLSDYHPLPVPTLNNTLLLQLHGETISCNLTSLANDPSAEGMISLLEACECERDKWIEVATSYRRQKNPSAAIAVLEGMVRGMLPIFDSSCVIHPIIAFLYQSYQLRVLMNPI